MTQCQHHVGYSLTVRRNAASIRRVLICPLNASPGSQFCPAHRAIAVGRDETDPCEALTPGCCIDHNRDTGDCQTW